MKTKIVIIDDEDQIRRLLHIALKSDGYEVSEAANAETGLALAARQQPDLIVLDLGLPDRDGSEVLTEIRRWSNVPVIVLSVRNNESEKVRLLDAGARDYVTKPFGVEEFLARVRANLRDHARLQPPPILDDGHLRIDIAKRTVQVDGGVIELTPREFEVLSMLAAAPNCVVTKLQLLRQIWGKTHKDDNHYLRIVISHLRRKIGDDPFEPKYIKTESAVGYRLIFKNQSS